MTIQGVCADCQVRDHSLCASLTNAELVSFSAIGRQRALPRGQTLVWGGEEALVCANLLSGVLKLSATTADGREQIVGLLYAADFVGRPYARDAEHTITALVDSQLCVFPRKAFEQALQDHANMERLLLRRTLDALDAARARMLLLGRKTAEEKVASFLLDIGDHLAGQRAQRRDEAAFDFDLPLTRAQIADVLGLTIETVSRQLTRLKQAGVIAVSAGRGITIRDPKGLERRAEAA